MIKFKKVSYRNLQAVGNAPITVLLDKWPTTVIGGRNGAGKSTVLEALAYGLYGKPLKDLKLAGLINKKNKKALKVEIEFEKNGVDYKVVRGQKPSVFEIWVGEDLLDQSAASKDYQARLEHVLSMDFKLFTQIVLLNKERYVPFMELDAASRRKVIDPILDVAVFNHMSDILKTDTRDLPNQINDVKYEREKLQERIAGHDRLISAAEENTESMVRDLEEGVTTFEAELTRKLSESETIETELNSLSTVSADLQKVEARQRKFEDIASKFSSDVKRHNETSEFYDGNDNCPTCKQEIDADTKEKHKKECEEKVEAIKANAAKMTVEYQKVLDQAKTLHKALQRTQELRGDLRVLNAEISAVEADIESKKRSIKKLQQQSKVDEYKAEKSKTEAELTDLTEKLNGLLDLEVVYSQCKTMLKDDGIKAAIVRDYIGFINSRVNEYLNAMEFYICCTLDENFNDTIASVGKEDFVYGNLSSGQKTRVNLAIWLALLEVSSIKNSAVTNILFLDEVLEALDADGVSMFMKLVKDKLPQKNLFVITQRFDEFKDYFHSDIQFKLGEDEFTEIA